MNLNLFEDNSPAAPLAVQVEPAIDYSVRGLCVKPYPLHPKGCPNFGKCDRCPPKAPLFDQVFDLRYPVLAVVNEFDLAAHVAKMAIRNPSWGERQLRCVLYWQGTARKQLREKIEKVLHSPTVLHHGVWTTPSSLGYEATWCPEGMGVDVTATMERAGIHLEWPIVKIARQVALIGKPAEK